jgi:hypothetical protein
VAPEERQYPAMSGCPGTPATGQHSHRDDGGQRDQRAHDPPAERVGQRPHRNPPSEPTTTGTRHQQGLLHGAEVQGVLELRRERAQQRPRPEVDREPDGRQGDHSARRPPGGVVGPAPAATGRACGVLVVVSHVVHGADRCAGRCAGRSGWRLLSCRRPGRPGGDRPPTRVPIRRPVEQGPWSRHRGTSVPSLAGAAFGPVGRGVAGALVRPVARTATIAPGPAHRSGRRSPPAPDAAGGRRPAPPPRRAAAPPPRTLPTHAARCAALLARQGGCPHSARAPPPGWRRDRPHDRSRGRRRSHNCRLRTPRGRPGAGTIRRPRLLIDDVDGSGSSPSSSCIPART